MQNPRYRRSTVNYAAPSSVLLGGIVEPFVGENGDDLNLFNASTSTLRNSGCQALKILLGVLI